jgi:hypothetical protein
LIGLDGIAGRYTQPGDLAPAFAPLRRGEQAPLQLCEFLINFASMAATKFEFEKRFWIICAIYLVAFLLSVFDHTPFIVALRHLIAPFDNAR